MQFLVYAFAKVVQRLIIWAVAIPVLLIVSTPFILMRGWVLAARKRQKFRYAVADGYDAIWTLWSDAVMQRNYSSPPR